MSSASAASWSAVPSAAVWKAAARHSRPGAPRRPTAQAIAATRRATRIARSAIHPHGVSSPELGVVVAEEAAVTVRDVVAAVGVVVSVVALPPAPPPVVVRVPENPPDTEPVNELGIELGSELGRPPPPPQPPSSRPTTRAGAAIAHHHDPAERRLGLIGVVHTTCG